mmetsp:Transcript_17633/g.49180  ORF Transcript_17633/g.49180 Transcript_17633/m.49180 type:complete len:210 (-) Transcript_17633:1222-1851(-)
MGAVREGHQPFITTQAVVQAEVAVLMGTDLLARKRAPPRYRCHSPSLAEATPRYKRHSPLQLLRLMRAHLASSCAGSAMRVSWLPSRSTTNARASSTSPPSCSSTTTIGTATTTPIMLSLLLPTPPTLFPTAPLLPPPLLPELLVSGSRCRGVQGRSAVLPIMGVEQLVMTPTAAPWQNGELACAWSSCGWRAACCWHWWRAGRPSSKG